MSNKLTKEEQAIKEVILSARTIQEFLWGHANGDWGLEEWLRMFRKRVAKMDEIKRTNPHAKVEIRKRLLQNAALSIAFMRIIDERGIPWDAAPDAPSSNLPQYANLPLKRQKVE